MTSPFGVEVSFSRIKAYDACPWLYKLLYLDRRRPPISPQSALGHSLHRALAAFYGARGASLEALLDAYQACWHHGGYSDPRQEVEFHRRGMDILRRFWPMEEARRSKVLFVEREFTFPLGPYSVRGIVDRVDEAPDGTIEVIDFKSQQDPESEAAVADNFQLQLYALGCREAWGMDPKRVGIIYLSAPAHVAAAYDPAKGEEMKARLEASAAKMAAGDFSPDTRHCPACPLRRSCDYSVARS